MARAGHTQRVGRHVSRCVEAPATRSLRCVRILGLWPRDDERKMGRLAGEALGVCLGGGDRLPDLGGWTRLDIRGLRRLFCCLLCVVVWCNLIAWGKTGYVVGF
jgi:hypothetical protein